MRVVSQDGMIDVPYEISAFSFGHKANISEFNIYIRSKFLDEKPCIIATYSTQEKAMLYRKSDYPEYFKESL